ncbi:unnamed protein product [Mytilus coruscus]|uniref:Core-binding (CB) domain-containing protein n=1 Tax=Mytilus coruscus TaxID=42192 RepID=A0A6J8BS19_MYTCO|nr:unnamed protein product [Mytilus coruscus]
MCSDKERQHKRSTIHKSSRGDEVTKFMLLDLGAMADSNSKQYSLESTPHYGQKECFSGSFESGKGLSDRMVSEQVYSAADFSDMGNPIDRFVCIMGKSPDRNILHLNSSSQCFGLGCSDNSLGEHVRVCVPPNLSDSKDIAIYEAVPLSDNFHCAPVAKETLVHRDFAVTDSLSNKTTSNGQFVVSGQNENFSSKSRNIKSNSMASFDRRFKTEGFSQSAKTLLSASWRDGTKKDYSSKFEKFNSWCGERQIDPYSENVNQVADFLAYLFHFGLQYRTIAGYRSMLSAVLPPVQNFPVGQHPNIVRIIKGVFNSRPPKVKILPEWNLELLLQALEKKPFEPMQEVDLKHITLKTVFLVAITTFRRCSDLQSLRTDDKHGLAKQDRQKHFEKKLFVPSFPEKTLIDPKRALSVYLDKTKNFRKKLSESERIKLFLGINEPHKPVSTATISSWIVQAIRIAYDDDNMKVNAHSTRAIAPSWALNKGASLKSILDSADWAVESTFAKFYLRDFDATKSLAGECADHTCAAGTKCKFNGDVDCVNTYCTDLPSTPKAEIVEWFGLYRNFDMANKYKCQNGYLMIGRHFAICRATGDWDVLFSCIEGEEFNGHRYFFQNEVMKWDDAKNHCAGLSASLVAIGSEEENSWIREQASIHYGRFIMK